MAERTDPITVEVIRNTYVSIATQMNNNLARSAYTPVIYEMKDCSVGIYDVDGRLLGQAPGLPFFLGSLGGTLRAVIEIKVRTEGVGGFDAIAERISAFEQVESCYLMSGGYDLLVVVTADNLYKVAGFVHERLARIDGVQGTSTHFFLRAYKKDGFVVTDAGSGRDRPSVSP